ncbi:MAG: ATP-binding protein [Pirellulaceae bacterium]
MRLKAHTLYPIIRAPFCLYVVCMLGTLACVTPESTSAQVDDVTMNVEAATDSAGEASNSLTSVQKASSIAEAYQIRNNDPLTDVPIEIDCSVLYYSLREQILFVDDGSSATFVRLPILLYQRNQFNLGDLIHIQGIFDGEEQSILAQQADFISQGKPRDPLPVDFSHMALSSNWCRRIVTTGHVSAVVYSDTVSRLIVSANDSQFVVQLPDGCSRPEVERYVDTKIEVLGTLDYIVDDLGRPTQALVRVNDNEMPLISSMGSTSIDGRKIIVSLDDLYNSESLLGSQVRVHGQITFISGSTCLLEDSRGTLLIQGPCTRFLEVNTIVEVIGRLCADGIRPEMDVQFVAWGGEANALPTEHTSAKNIVDDGVPLQRCRLSGVVMKVHAEGTRRHVLLKDQGIVFSVNFVAATAAFERLRLGEAHTLSVEGLVLPPHDADEHEFSMLLASADSIQIERRWVDVHRHQIILAGLIGLSALMLASAWGLSLQSQVRRKTKHLALLSARLNCSYEAIKEGILIVDAKWHIECLTHRFLQIINAPNSKFHNGFEVMQHLAGIVVDQPKLLAMLERVENDNRSYVDCEFELKSPDATRRFIMLYGAPVMAGKDTVTGRLWALHDISRSKQLERSMMHSQKMEAIGRLAGGISHDFNNLLMAISGNLELARIAPDQPVNTVLDALQAAELATDRAARVVKSLLGFSRQSPVALVVENANDVIREMQHMLSNSLGKHVELQLQLADDLWLAKIDGTQLQQVLLNLCLNARDAIQQASGWIRIESRNETAAEGDFVRISVVDNGSGISDQVLCRIFEPFFSTKPTGQGTGLGLAISYGIISQHGGRIECSTQLGEGSRFDILLPREPAPLECSDLLELT